MMRYLLSLFRPNNKLSQDTYVTLSTFTGSDAGVGKHLTPRSNRPLNVDKDRDEIATILGTITDFQTLNGPRDAAAAIRDAAGTFLSQYRSLNGSILYLVTRYSEGGSIINELEMVETLLNNNIQLIGVELADRSPNRLTNLNRIAQLTGGYNFPEFGDNWSRTNGDAANQLLSSAFNCVKSRRRGVSYYFSK